MEDTITEAKPGEPQFKGSFSSKGEKLSDKPLEQKPAAVETPPTPEPAPTPEPVVEPTQPIDYLKVFNERAGFQFQSEDELVNKLKSSRELETKFTEYEKELNRYKAIDPRALEIDNVLKSGTDLNLFLEAKQFDIQALEGKEAMYHKFLRENPGYEREYAKLLFEKQYQRDYSIIDQVFDENSVDPMELPLRKKQFEDEQKLARMDREHKQKEAKRFLSDWKAKLTTVPEAKPVDQEALYKQFRQQAEQIAGQTEKFEIQVEDKKFNFGLDGFKGELKDKLSDPVKAFKELGYDAESGSIDPNKIAEALKALHIVKNIGKPLKDWALEQFNIQTVAATLRQPAPPQPIAGGVPVEDHMTKVGKALIAAKGAATQMDR